MSSFWRELFLDLNDATLLARAALRLVIATLLGGLLGYERLRDRKPAGLRTHMLVALGAALFTVVPAVAGMSQTDFSRIIQGVATGIGFLGAGTILKLGEDHKVEGLTSAASIWLTAGVGMAVGAGWLWPAVAGVVLGWTVLFSLHHLEQKLRQNGQP
jgi:putative Mg2+ transporter-C (MgtC) family protein